VKEYPKRHYQSLRQYWDDLRYVFNHLAAIREGIHKTLDPAFRERLMLVVTRINNCPYCLHIHSRLARAAGVPPFEVRELMERQIPDGAPAEERAALHYAREWAENNARTDEAEKQKIVDTYGEEKARAIYLALKLIWIGNLSGNTFDYFIYRLSFGRWRLKQTD